MDYIKQFSEFSGINPLNEGLQKNVQEVFDCVYNTLMEEDPSNVWVDKTDIIWRKRLNSEWRFVFAPGKLTRSVQINGYNNGKHEFMIEQGHPKMALDAIKFLTSYGNLTMAFNH